MRRTTISRKGEDGMDHGEMTSAIDTGKKIDEWVFESGFPMPKETEEMRALKGWQDRKIGDYRASIRIVHARALDDNRMQFEAISNWFEKPLVASDINKLRADVERKFREIDEAARSVVWEEWIEVRVDQAELRARANEKINAAAFPEAFDPDEDNPRRKKRSRSGSTELRCGWKLIKRGRTKSGGDLTITENGRVGPFPKPKAAGVADASTKYSFNRDEIMDSRSESSEYAYIPATPENIRALANLKAMIEAANAKLVELLGQASIEASIAKLAVGGLALLDHKGDK